MRPRTVLTFGEVLLRLSPNRIDESSNEFSLPPSLPGEPAATLRAWWGGSEANVAVGMARLGVGATLCTRLPDNPLGAAAQAELHRQGVSVIGELAADSRLGLYFAAQRSQGKVQFYDRAGSAFALDPLPEGTRSALDWTSFSHLHLSGITPALSPACARAAEQMLSAATGHGLPTSFDLNLRRQLWDDNTAARTLRPMLRNVDTLIASRGQLLGAFTPGNFAPKDRAKASETEDSAERLQALRADLEVRELLVTERDAGDGCIRLRAILVREGGIERVTTPRFTVSDRVGSGDAFVAGFLATRPRSHCEHALRAGLAAASLSNQSEGDFPTFDRSQFDTRLREFFG